VPIQSLPTHFPIGFAVSLGVGTFFALFQVKRLPPYCPPFERRSDLTIMFGCYDSDAYLVGGDAIYYYGYLVVYVIAGFWILVAHRATS